MAAYGLRFGDANMNFAGQWQVTDDWLANYDRWIAPHHLEKQSMDTTAPPALTNTELNLTPNVLSETL